VERGLGTRVSSQQGLREADHLSPEEVAPGQGTGTMGAHAESQEGPSQPGAVPAGSGDAGTARLAAP
jgi:hypothetical protein